MSQGVGGHAAFQPGVFNGMLERLINAGDRRAPPLDRVAFADSKTLPPAKMRQEPVGNASWRLSLFRFSLSLRAAVEHTSVKVDPSGAIRRSQRGFTNRTGSGSGIKTYQDETGDVLAGPASGRSTLLDFPIAPARPNELRGFRAC
jgi:hypothetical protein